MIVAGGILLIGVLVFAASLWLSIAYFGIRPFVAAEYGQGLPNPSAFGDRVVGYAEASEPQKGVNRVRLRLENGGERVAWLTVRDTTAPTAEPAERTISTLVTLKPTDLIEHLADADLVGVSFASVPPFGTVGDYSVEILLEDVSNNKTSLESTLHIRVVNEGVTIEAGEDAPSVESFLIDDYAVERVAGLDAQTIRTPGKHSVFVTIDGETYETFLTVTDTVAPTAETQTLFLKPGTNPDPADFLRNVSDGSDVSAAFLQAPDPDVRTFQTVEIRLTDAAGNTFDCTASLLFTDILPITIEARNSVLTIEDCFPDGVPEGAALLTSFITNRLGTFSVSVAVDGTEEMAIIEVVDTTAPVLYVRKQKYYTNHPLPTEELYTAVVDGTETTVTASEIDWSFEGVQTVTLTAVDAAGNESEDSFELTLVRDAVAPTLYGVRDRNAYVGEPVAYLAEVFATDALDGEIAVTVDASAVDPNRAGTYTVTYTATDLSGNATVKSCRFTFTNPTVSEEELRALTTEIVARVTTPDMTKTENLVALYRYVYDRITYNGKSDKTDWRKEAVNGIRLGVGDCFTYYATLRALLDETDIEYMSVTRKGGATRHFWLLVNVGTGWYHLDANHNATAHWECFMWTNAQCASPAGFWTFDQSLYPAVATEPFVASAVIAAEKAERNESIETE